MKLLSLLGFFMILNFSLVAQDYDQRLLSKFDSKTLVEMSQNQPEQLALLTYALDHGYYIAEGGNTKGVSLPTIAMPSNNQTFLDLGLEIQETNQYFQIEGQSMLLVMKSSWVLNHEMEKK